MITWSYVKQMKYDIIGVGGAKPAHGLRISCARAGSAHGILSSECVSPLKEEQQNRCKGLEFWGFVKFTYFM